MTTSNEIAIREGVVVTPADRVASASAAVREGSIDSWLIVMKDVVLLAEHIADTSFVPKTYRGNAPAVAAAILAGRELGLQPMTALRHVQVVEGSPGLSAEYKRARVLSAGHKLDIEEHTTEACQVTGHRKGHQSVTVRYTIGDARKAGLVKDRGAYMTRPRRMLFARACTEVCDALFSDLTNGLPTVELLESGEEGDAPIALDAPQPRPEVADLRQRAAAQTVTATVVTPDSSPAQPVPPPASAAPVAGAGEDPTTSPQASSPAGQGRSPEAMPQSSASSPSGSATTPAQVRMGPDSAGTVTDPQLKAIWTILGNVFHFKRDDEGKDEVRAVCASIVDHELKTTTQLSFNEAGRILDTLDQWRREAAEAAANPREYLELMTAPQDAQDGADGGQ